jgi:hypothetical protein
MKFGTWLRLALVSPAAVMLACYWYLLYLFSGRHSDPGWWLLAMALMASLLALLSVILALRSLVRSPQARSAGNVACTVAALLFLGPVFYAAYIVAGLYLALQ